MVMIKRYIAFVWLCLWGMVLKAAIQVKATAPEAVEVGEQFRLSFVINSQDVSNFQWNAPNAFSVDMGPSRSSSSSVQIINGKMSQSSTMTYTYILSALKEGEFTIPGATVSVEGKTYQSNSVRIRVLPDVGGTNSRSAHGNNGGGANRMRSQDAGAQVTGKDLFVTVTANKQHLYEQEAVVVTYKVYSLVDLSQLAGGMPELEGFHMQEIELPAQKSFKMENHNGKNYGTVVWRQYVLFPQRSGKLKIPSIKFDAIVRQRNPNIDPFEAFFGGGSAVVEMKKTIVAPELTLNVEPLLSKPENFSGAVGNFHIEASLTPENLKSNDALTLRLTVSGEGNMKLMKAPVVDFPKDFETYDAKITDKTKIGKSGAVGSKVFDFIAVPRHAGQYTIPPVAFCYFDPAAKAYKTLQTQEFKIDVAKGVGGGSDDAVFTNKEDVKMLASDIRYIHQGKADLRNPGERYFGTMAYMWSFLIPLLLFVALVIVFRKQALESANVAKMRNKKASKAAVKRLKRAAALLKANQPSEFYEEVLKALWGYVGDKLNISVAELNKDNVTEKLQAKGASEDIIRDFVETLNECEFARYAPGDPAQTMDKIYASATEVINKMESTIKR